MGVLDKYEAPRFTLHRKRDIPWNWIGSVIVLLLIIGLIFYFVTRPAATVPAPTDSQPSSAPSPESSSPSPAEAPVVAATPSSTPEFDTKCAVVAGVVPGSVKTFDNTITVTIKNSGKQIMGGSYFEFSSDDKKTYKMNAGLIEPGEFVTYSVGLDDAAVELGTAVKSFVILPIQNGKACLNQRMVVLK